MSKPNLRVVTQPPLLRDLCCPLSRYTQPGETSAAARDAYDLFRDRCARATGPIIADESNPVAAETARKIFLALFPDHEEARAKADKIRQLYIPEGLEPLAQQTLVMNHMIGQILGGA